MTGADAPVFCFRYNGYMKWNRTAGLLLVFFSVIVLGISKWPASVQTEEIPFSVSGDMAGMLIVSQPVQSRVGEKAELSLSVEINQNENTTQELVFMSELELNNIEVAPKGEGKVRIDPSKPLKLRWNILPGNSGSFSGTLWLFYETKNGEKQLILARPITLEARTILGFSIQSVWMICIFCFIVSLFLFFLPVDKIKKLR